MSEDMQEEGSFPYLKRDMPVTWESAVPFI